MENLWKFISQRYFASVALMLFVSVLTVLLPQTASAPTTTPRMQNITIEVPYGSRDHGDPKLVCTPTKWTDVALFFVANFVAHAATVKSIPGEPFLSATTGAILALILPASGIVRALSAIYHRAALAETPLRTALRAKALCTVVRSPEWEPRNGETVECLEFRTPKKVKDAIEKKPGFEFLNWKEPEATDNWGRRQSPKKPGRSTEEAELKVPTLTIKIKRVIRMGDPRVYPRPFFYPSTSIWATSGRVVHRVCELPSGYALSIVPPETEISDYGHDWDDEASDSEVQYNLERDDEDQCNEMSDNEEQPEKEGNRERVCNGEKSEKDGESKEQEDKRQHKEGLVNEGPGYGIKVAKRRSLPLSPSDQRQRHEEDVQIKTPKPTSPVSQVSSKNELAKALIAIIQTLYAGATLYRVRGDQIERYGFAAFGLTVSPYLIMSIVNLASITLTPDYPAVYMVRSNTLDEASKRDGARFEGVIGSIRSRRSVARASGKIRFTDTDGQMILEPGPDGTAASHVPPATLPTKYATIDHKSPPRHHRDRNLSERPLLMIPSCSEFDITGDERKEPLNAMLLASLSTAVTSISIAINGALSHFRSGHSTSAQKGWTMAWLVFGVFYGPFIVLFESDGLERLFLIIYAAPSIGGFVVVGQMLMEYGHCTRLG